MYTYMHLLLAFLSMFKAPVSMWARAKISVPSVPARLVMRCEPNSVVWCGVVCSVVWCSAVQCSMV